MFLVTILKIGAIFIYIFIYHFQSKIHEGRNGENVNFEFDHDLTYK